MHAETVALAGAHMRNVAVPAEGGAFGQRNAAFLAVRIEEAQLNGLRNL
jgi:hypothetical protein